MLSVYEIAMLLTIAASFVYIIWRLYHAIELEKIKDSDNDEC